MSAILLDTCAAIWIAEDDGFSDEAKAEVEKAARDNTLHVSPMSGWEIGLLASRGRLRLSVTPDVWFNTFLRVPGVRLADLSVHILIASSFLPGTPPRDPVDRIITATARALGCKLITRDRQLLDYAEQGHVQALAC